MREALAIESEAAESVQAAEAEQQRGEPELSLGLLSQAIERERDSLDLFEEGMETLRQALQDRRRALEQQQNILNQLVGDLNLHKKAE
ncbi:MAG TPA: hypothetical protein VJ124_05710 [Pyrinomonadaceae bacterium]|nr:hypothetical protein [Pyrinomonadaceae bacterium]